MAKGGSSTIYRAVQETRAGIRRLVALKVFAQVSSDDAERHFELTRRAAVRAACVHHPNVVAVHDFGVWRQQPYFVTELVEGVSLQLLLDRHAERGVRLPLDLALFIACEVAEALSGARTAKDTSGMQLGMLHLALGPRKVLLGWRGEVKVVDFETSMASVASSSVRSMRTVSHRAATMAPEVAQGVEPDARSDVFSLGVVLRELFVGPRFPRGASGTEVVRLAREGYVQPIPFQPHLPDALVHVMTRALQVDAEDRYPNASAMAFELRRVALALGVGDGRVFLRRALDREWGNDASEITTERLYGAAGVPALAPPRGAEVAEEDLAPLRDLQDVYECDLDDVHDVHETDEIEAIDDLDSCSYEE